MKTYDNLDFGQLQSLNRVEQNLASAPSSPKVGQAYYNTASNVTFVWNGTAWRPTDAASLTDGSVPIAALATNPLLRANHTGTQLASTISNLQTTVLTYTLDTFAAPVANVSFGGYRLTNLAAAVAGTDATNLTQVNSLIAAAVSGQTSIKNPVRVIAASNITLSGAQTIDGVSLAVGDRVLVSAQTTGSQNGIYVVAASAWAYASDVATTGQVIEGTEVLVNEGTVYGGSIWRQSTTGTITIGTTTQTWVQTTRINTYSADGVTLSLTGLQFSVLLAPSGGIVSTGGLGLKVDTTKVPQKYSTTITSDGVTSAWTITHSLGTTDIITEVRDSAGNKIIVDVQSATTTTCVVTFGVAQTNGTTFRITVMG